MICEEMEYGEMPDVPGGGALNYLKGSYMQQCDCMFKKCCKKYKKSEKKRCKSCPKR